MTAASAWGKSWRPRAVRKKEQPMCLAVPGKILSTSGDDLFRLARVSFGGAVKEISLACVPEAKVEDYVLVHAGFAISTIAEAEAAEVFAYLKKMDELQPPQ
jgi:hydrogenase expression/formation protein HypC